MAFNLFMGDSIFWQYLRCLSSQPHPLIHGQDGTEFRQTEEYPDMPSFNQQQFRFTKNGEDVILSHQDAVHLRGIDRWLGGAHLQKGNIWRWGDSKHELAFAP